MPALIQTIVVGVATVNQEDPLLPAAIAVANRIGARLHLVHAFDLPAAVTASPHMVVTHPNAEAYHAGRLRDLLDAQVRSYFAREPVSIRVVPGPAADAIAEAARETNAGLVVVGPTRRGRLGQAVLGTTAERVIRGSPAPVLVLRQPLAPVAERVLLTTDLSELSAETHERGLDLVETLFGSAKPLLRSLLVIGYDVALPPPLTGDLLQDIAAGELDGFLSRRRPRWAEVEARVRTGEPAYEIVAEAAAWKADLLVTGTHARRGRSRLFLGSVAEASVRGAPCNVLVIPPAAAEAEESASGMWMPDALSHAV